MPNSAVSINTLGFLRYGALGFGLIYGFTKNQSYNAQYKSHAAHDKVVQEAKDKAAGLWADHLAKEMNIVTDPDDPKFDLEKVMEYASNLS